MMMRYAMPDTTSVVAILRPSRAPGGLEDAAGLEVTAEREADGVARLEDGVSGSAT